MIIITAMIIMVGVKNQERFTSYPNLKGEVDSSILSLFSLIRCLLLLFGNADPYGWSWHEVSVEHL